VGLVRWQPPRPRRAQLALAATIAVVAAPFVIAMTRSAFWQPERSTAPFATAAVSLLLVAFVLRQRWAWSLIVAAAGSAVVIAPFDSGVDVRYLLPVAGLALLLSAPSRRHVARRAAAPGE
jgi:hypothetical protein